MIQKFSEKNLDRVNEITELLHLAYAPLAANGMKYLASHQLPEKTLERLLEGESYFVEQDQKIVATVTLKPSQTNSACAWYNKKGIYSFGQFAVSPNLQKQGLGARMMDFVENRAAELNALEIALDTSEHASHLIKMYEKRNYRFIQHVQWSVTNYLSVVMSKKLREDI